MASTEMDKAFENETREIVFDGKTYQLKKLRIGKLLAVKNWMSSKKRAPYINGKIDKELSAKVLAEMDSRGTQWWECISDISAHFFVVYLAIKEAMIATREQSIRISEEIVIDKLELDQVELAKLSMWLCRVEYVEEKSKDGEIPLDEKAVSAGQ